jgi:hypothetical protein
MEKVFVMPVSLHIANLEARRKVCGWPNDCRRKSLYVENMAKKSRPVINVGWYLSEWMDTLRVRQSDMVERAGWSKTTASLLYNRQQDYSPRLVEEASLALNIAPFELLLHPEDAMAIRRMRDSAVTIAADRRHTFTPAPVDDKDGDRKAS